MMIYRKQLQDYLTLGLDIVSIAILEEANYSVNVDLFKLK